MLNYIDDFGGITVDHHTATHHFHMLQSLLQHLSLKEAAYKASPLAQAITWLRPWFTTIEMSVTIPQEKFKDTLQLVEDWAGRQVGSQHSPALDCPWQVATHSSVLPVCQTFP